jgi:hypothetical protein
MNTDMTPMRMVANVARDELDRFSGALSWWQKQLGHTYIVPPKRILEDRYEWDALRRDQGELEETKTALKATRTDLATAQARIRELEARGRAPFSTSRLALTAPSGPLVCVPGQEEASMDTGNVPGAIVPANITLPVDSNQLMVPTLDANARVQALTGALAAYNYLACMRPVD